MPPAPRQPWHLDQDEVTLVKNHIAKGASDTELHFCLTVARRYKLDPFRGQIWFVKRNDKSAQGGERWIPIVGINGLLHVAARDHHDFGSIEEPEYGPMIDIPWTYYEKKGTLRAPEWARITAWKRGFEHPIKATVYFEEIYPNVGASPMVRQMPRHMLGKCAMAHVVRKAWPGTDGLYIREEFQGPAEFTDSGRRIVYPEAEEAQPAILDANAPHGHEPGSEKAMMAEAALKRVEEADRALKEKKFPGSNPGRAAAHVDSGSTESEGLKPSAAKPASIPEDKPLGTIELDMTTGDDVIIRGDIGPLLEMIQKHCTAKWGSDSWWHILPADVSTIHAMGQQCRYRVTEILPKSFPPREKSEGAQSKAATNAQAKAPSQSSGAKATPANKTSAAVAASPASNEPHIVTGVIAQFTEKMTKGTRANPEKGIKGRASVPYLTVLIKTDKGSQWCSAFDHTLFPFIQKGKISKKGEFVVQKSGEFWNLLGFRKLESLTFDEDNKTPCIQRDREPGSPNLFQP